MSITIKELLNRGVKQLSDNGTENAAGDARVLLCHQLGLDGVHLFLEQSKQAAEPDQTGYEGLIRRRIAGEPLQYIIGSQDFMGLTFRVDPRVLIPRGDTEPMVEEALQWIGDRPLRVLDICTGSGAIGLSIACLAPKTTVTCTDLSPEALELAQENARLLGADQVRFLQGDLLDALPGEERFDLILSNPPYIPTEVVGGLQTEIRDHEPLMALDGGADGLDIYRRLIPQITSHLQPDGAAMVEIGDDQGRDVSALFTGEGAYSCISVHQDLSGRDRYVVAARFDA